MRSWLLALVILSLVATGCTRKRYRMPSGSMWPTLHVGDTLVADKSRKTPGRGDVFAFHYPEHPDQDFVKRIVGLPGDRIETRGPVLVVNGVPLKRCVIGPASYDDEGTVHRGELSLEGSGYLVFHEDGIPPSDGSWVVAANQFWAMGDNRSNSHDSRMWYGGQGGGVPRENLVGIVPASTPELPKGAEALAPKLAGCKMQLGG